MMWCRDGGLAVRRTKTNALQVGGCSNSASLSRNARYRSTFPALFPPSTPFDRSTTIPTRRYISTPRNYSAYRKTIAFRRHHQVIANLGSALVFGSIFWKLGLGQTQINDRVGLLQVIFCRIR